VNPASKVSGSGFEACARAWARAAAGTVLVAATPVFAGQPLETETARLLPKGVAQFEGVLEYQTSKDGTESAAPIVLEYGLTDSLQFALEPVLYTSIQPKTGRSASGLGDLETTLTFSVVPEGAWTPALAIAGEIKFPTAHDSLIGTRKTDYRGVVIASKQLGWADAHLNLGYTVVGSPPGVKLDNVVDYGFALEFPMMGKMQLVTEFLGNTSSGGSEPVPGSSTVAAEVAGAEMIGLIGGRYILTRDTALSLGLTYDNNHALLTRAGISILFR
jgi:hypothetical protein